ncbi:MAG: exodeoxyribonuclease VII small subunit [Ruminococcus bicirculans (ex Wegman et al. 2014)]|nr:exodeoxyribonuclease VII small subunit [Ruminococcus bicirculans (ex Wegman et al. 2014)]MBC3512808.1 exodeoxyribonuclease VII small subunit [Ruminococcus bicirculans (ex Wegman et al. 2014)]MCC2215339.1 exodeoxyribonuclease VII small subunit [Hominimerdicola aceti]OLA47193.1 MAG: exodeoxyribonuclease VII small subunit [Ruminococcus bicirculans (ex Wegman et al. 2014)]
MSNERLFKMTFEENLTRLNDIVGQLENDKLPLEKALELYKEGIDLSVDCKKSLESAKLSVKAMNGDNSDE